jgi:hypothetical protein
MKTVDKAGEGMVPASASMVAPEQSDDDTLTYVVVVPFKRNGKVAEVDSKVRFPRNQGDHMLTRGFVRLPAADE